MPARQETDSPWFQAELRAKQRRETTVLEDNTSIVSHHGTRWHLSTDPVQLGACTAILTETALLLHMNDACAARFTGISPTELRAARMGITQLSASGMVALVTSVARCGRADTVVIDIAGAVNMMMTRVKAWVRDGDHLNPTAALDVARAAAEDVFASATTKRPWGRFPPAATSTMGPPHQWGTGPEAVGPTGQPWADFDLSHAFRTLGSGPSPYADDFAKALGDDWTSEPSALQRAMLGVVVNALVYVFGSDERAASAAYLAKPGTQASVSNGSIRRLRLLQTKTPPWLVIHRLVLAAAAECERFPIDPGHLVEHLEQATAHWLSEHGHDSPQGLLNHLHRIADAAIRFGIHLDERGHWEPPA